MSNEKPDPAGGFGIVIIVTVVAACLFWLWCCAFGAFIPFVQCFATLSLSCLP